MLALTDELIAEVPLPLKGHYEFRDYAVPGLRLRVKSSGVKTFVLRKRVNQHVRAIKIGHHDLNAFTITDARAKAYAIIRSIDSGAGAPSAPSSADRDTIEMISGRYLAAKASMRSIGEIKRIFRRDILPLIGERRPHTVSRSEITALIDGIQTPSMARAVAAQLSTFYNWMLPRFDTLSVNPCSNAGRPRPLSPRERVLSDYELRALWSVVSREPAPFGPGIKLLILTLQRRGEVFGADCSEFDLDNRRWTLPACRTKNARVQEVPMSDETHALVSEQVGTRSNGKLFPAKGHPERSASGFSKAWARIRRRVDNELGGCAERFTMHDLRRTGATAMQRLGVGIEVTEALLNHVSGSRSGIVGVYQRYGYYEEKRAALSAWSNELRKIIS